MKNLNEFTERTLSSALYDTRQEIQDATKRYGPALTRHDAMSILHEEVDEAWDKVKTNAESRALYRELIQVAAMAVRFAAQLSATP